MRIFILGNGPSLNKTPLDALVGEDSFAINRIHLLYDRTRWRPTYFWYVDHPTADDHWEDPIRQNEDTAKHMWLLDEYRTGVPDGAHLHDEHPPMRKIDLKHPERVTFLTRCKKHAYYAAGNPRGMQAWHLPDICTAYNGMSSMIQASVQMGYDEIYLLGCDLGYTVDYYHNHFDPRYCQTFIPLRNGKPDIATLAFWSQSDQANALFAHKIALKECQARGVKIYNATLGGELEVYPRVKLEDIL